jgi:hypothetical protein
MSSACIPSHDAVTYLMDRANHAKAAPWPPSVVTLHIYNAIEGHNHTKVTPRLILATMTAAQDVVSVVSKASGGQTTTFVDELGVFPCHLPCPSWSTVLDSGPGHSLFHNPRAAYFALGYAQWASTGVDSIASSQFFGFDQEAGKRNNWSAVGVDGASVHGSWYYPCLSALDWDSGLPNARFFALKLLASELGSDMKSVSPATVTPKPPPPAPHGQILGFGFTKVSTKQRILLLVNTGAQDRSVCVAGGGAAGATHVFVDESHGHGNVEPGRETLNATSVLAVRAFGISVVSWRGGGSSDV